VIPTTNSLKSIYEQVLAEVGTIDTRIFVHRFNQAINDLAVKYPSSMPIICAVLDTSKDYSEETAEELDNTGLTWNEIDKGKAYLETVTEDDGVFPHIFPLPKECAGIYRVYRIVNGEKRECKEYLVDHNGISFPLEGIYKVYYYSKTEIQTIDDTVKLPWQFFNAIVYFIVGNELMGENEQRAVFNLQRYEEMARQADINSKSYKTKNKRIKAPLWR
jgi:hypothetical protein